MDRQEIEDMITRHQPNLFAFLLRICGDADAAEEAMQETFVRAIRSIDGYKPIARPTTWLFTIALNIVRDRWRRRVEVVPIDDWFPSPLGSAEEEALAKVEAGEVRAALMRLPIEQRAAVVMVYYHDFTYTEVARVLGCPLGTVKSRIHKGLRRLEALLTVEVTKHDQDRGFVGSR